MAQPGNDTYVRHGGWRGGRLLWWIVGAALLAGVGWRIAVVQSSSADVGSQQQVRSSAGLAAGLTRYRPQTRPALPPLQGVTLDETRLNIRHFRGHVLVLNVWGSWCAPCRAEAPDLARASVRTYSKGVRFVGIDTRDSADAARAFERSFHITYPSLIDKDGRLLLALNGLVPVSAIPSTVFVDQQGRVAATIVGASDYSTLTGIVHDLLVEGQAK